MNLGFSKQARKLYLLRWNKIRRSPAIWILFALCLSFSFTTNTFIDDNSSASFLKAAIVVCNNICYGYIAGFVFYVLSVFFPDSKKEFEAYQRIYFNLGSVMQQLDFFEEQVLADAYQKDAQDYRELAFRMVNEGMCGINLVADNIFVSLKQEVALLMAMCKNRFQTFIDALSIDSKWMDAHAMGITQYINRFYSLPESVQINKDRVISSLELSSECLDFYVCKIAIKREMQKLQPYCMDIKK